MGSMCIYIYISICAMTCPVARCKQVAACIPSVHVNPSSHWLVRPHPCRHSLHPCLCLVLCVSTCAWLPHGSPFPRSDRWPTANCLKPASPVSALAHRDTVILPKTQGWPQGSVDPTSPSKRPPLLPRCNMLVPTLSCFRALGLPRVRSG